MDILLNGTLVCLSFLPIGKKFDRCDPVPRVCEIKCDNGLEQERCINPKYRLCYDKCKVSVSSYSEIWVSRKSIKPVVLWEEFESSPGVYTKNPICPEKAGEQ